MTSRERLLATLAGRRPDRVPVAPFVQEEYLSYYFPQKPSVDRVIDAVELATELDFDLMAKHRALERPYFLRRSYPNWELRQSQASEDGMIRRRIEIVTPCRTLVREETGPQSGAATSGVHFMVTRPLLADSADIEAFLKYLPRLDAGGPPGNARGRRPLAAHHRRARGARALGLRRRVQLLRRSARAGQHLHGAI